jgi:hypothetical protein
MASFAKFANCLVFNNAHPRAVSVSTTCRVLTIEACPAPVGRPRNTRTVSHVESETHEMCRIAHTMALSVYKGWVATDIVTLPGGDVRKTFVCPQHKLEMVLVSRPGPAHTPLRPRLTRFSMTLRM